MRTFIISFLLLWSSVSQGQYFNQRYTLNSPTTYFNNIASTDTCIYISGAMVGQDGYNKAKIFISQFGFDGSVDRKQYYTLDTSETYLPSIHSAQVRSLSFNLCGAGIPYPSQGLTKAMFIDISLPTFTESHIEYNDSVMIHFYFNCYTTLSSKNRMYLGNYETQQYRVGYFILKTDSSGNEQFRRYYPLTSDWQAPSIINQLKSGNLLISSQHANLNQGGFNYSYTQLIEIDTFGNQIHYWHDSASLGRSFSPVGMEIMPDGSKIYVTNYLDSQVIATQFETDLYRKGYIVKLDSAYNKVWELKVGHGGLVTDLYQMKKLSDGNFLAIGNDFDSLGTPRDGLQAGWLIKFTDQGHILWERHYASAKYENYLLDFVELNNGDILACGQVIDGTIRDSVQQGWLLRLDRDGCLGDRCTTGIEYIPIQKINLYPNPTTHSIHIEGITDDAEYAITDIIGQSLLHGNLNPLHEIDLTPLSSGIYLIDILTDGQHITRKIMKE